MATSKTNQPISYRIVEHGVIAPESIGPKQQGWKDLTLSREYDPAKTWFIATAMSTVDVAYGTVTARWIINSSGYASRIKIYITNLYENAAQDIGAFYFIVEKVE